MDPQKDVQIIQLINENPELFSLVRSRISSYDLTLLARTCHLLYQHELFHKRKQIKTQRIIKYFAQIAATECIQYVNNDSIISDENKLAIIKGAALAGYIHILEIFINSNEYDKMYKLGSGCAEVLYGKKFLYKYAAKRGQMDIIHWANDQKIEYSTRNMTHTAIKYGQLSVLLWILSKSDIISVYDCIKYYDISLMAARKGYLDIFIWTTRNYSFWVNDADTYYGAAIDNGHLHIIQYIDSAYQLKDPDSALIMAARINQPEIFKWAIRKGYKGRINTACQDIASEDNLEMLQLLDREDIIANIEALIGASTDNETYIMDWLYSQNLLHNESLLVVTYYGQLTLLKWLLGKGYTMDKTSLYKKAVQGLREEANSEQKFADIFDWLGEQIISEY